MADYLDKLAGRGVISASRMDILRQGIDRLKESLVPDYLRDTPSSPQADRALADPNARPGKIGPPSGPPTTLQQMGGVAADVGLSALPFGKLLGMAAPLKGAALGALTPFGPGGISRAGAGSKIMNFPRREGEIYFTDNMFLKHEPQYSKDEASVLNQAANEVARAIGPIEDEEIRSQHRQTLMEALHNTFYPGISREELVSEVSRRFGLSRETPSPPTKIR